MASISAGFATAWTATWTWLTSEHPLKAAEKKTNFFRKWLAPGSFLLVAIVVTVIASSLEGRWFSIGLQIGVLSVLFGLVSVGVMNGWLFVVGFVGFVVPAILLGTQSVPAAGHDADAPGWVEIVNAFATVGLAALAAFGPGAKNIYKEPMIP